MDELQALAETLASDEELAETPASHEELSKTPASHEELSKTPASDEEARLALLWQLVDRLAPKERHALALMISIKNDRLAALPVELLIRVLSHLPLLHTWTLRQVCRQWRDLLSSEQMVEAALKRWNSHRPEDGVKPPHVFETLEDILHRMQSWRLGRPFSTCSKHISISGYGARLLQSARAFALSGHYIAYIEKLPGEGQSVIVLDLLKGTHTKYRGAAREHIMCLTLTNSLVAYCSFTGKLYASMHDHTQLGSVQLPSAGIAAFSADQDTVGVVLQSAGSASTKVILYNCSNRTTRDFAINPPRAQFDSDFDADFDFDATCPINVLQISVNAETVDIFGQACLFTDISRTSQNSYVEHRRYSFTGEYLSSSSWKGQGMRTRVTGRVDFFSLTDLHHTGVPGLYVFRTQVLQSADQIAPLRTGKPPLQMLLCFDSDKARLFEHVLPSNYAISGGSWADDVCPMLWKDVEIRPDPVLSFSTLGNTDREHGYQVRNSWKLKSQGHDRPSQVLANESFVIATSWLSQAQEWHVSIFCFEDNLDWGVSGAEVTSTSFWAAATSAAETDDRR